MANLETIRFHNPKLFSGKTGTVDHDKAVIHGVSLITGDLEAEGHNLFVDSTTLSQLHALGKEMGQVAVTLDHGGGIKSINGYIDNVRLDGNKWRGDWNLLQTHDETPIMLERAARQPTTFGMSVAFKGPPKGVKVGDKQCARAEKLLSVDCVTRAAANPDGMFGVKDEPENSDSVDNIKLFNTNFPMANENEPTLAQVLQAVNALTGRIDTFEQTQGQIIQHINSQGEGGAEGEMTEAEIAQLTDLYNMSPAQLAAYNRENGTQITRAEIDGAVDSYNAGLEGGGEGGVEGGEPGEPGGEMANQHAETGGAAAGNAGVEGAAAGTMLHALGSEVRKLRMELDARKRAEIKAAEDHEFAVVEENINTLASAREQAIELAEKLVAENECLRIALRTGTRPVKAGVDSNVRLFSANVDGELHEFQEKVKEVQESQKVSAAKAIQFVAKNFPAIHRDYLKSQTIHA